jgi:carbamoyl-phosphate synthase large subunit
VDAVIPGSDPEVAALSKLKNHIENDTRAKLIVSSPDTVEIGNDKWKTFLFFKEHGFRTPETVLPNAVKNNRSHLSYPLIVKPRTGSASKGLFIARDRNELEIGIKRCRDPIIQEYIFPGNWEYRPHDLEYLSRQRDEYSVEVLVSRDGKILGSIANWREMVKGVPTRAIIDDYNDFRAMSEGVVKHLDAQGPVNLQLRKSREGITYFEINVRFSGSTAVRCAAGFNGPDAVIRDMVLNEPVVPGDLAYEKLVEMRYKDELYITPQDYEDIKTGGSTGPRGQTLGYF